MSSPDLTSSESEKGARGSPASTLGLNGSGSRIRVSQRGCSTTARSPSGERRPSVSRRVTAPLLRPVATPTASLTRSGGDGGGEENRMALGFAGNRPLGGFVHARIAHHRPSQMNGSRRFGQNVAQAGDEFRGPGLRCILSFRACWSGPCFGSLGRMWPRRAMSFAAQAFATLLNFHAGWSGPYFFSWVKIS
jgi:hypothetical protein